MRTANEIEVAAESISVWMGADWASLPEEPADPTERYCEDGRVAPNKQAYRILAAFALRVADTMAREPENVDAPASLQAAE